MLGRWWSARKAERALRELEWLTTNTDIWISDMMQPDEEEAIEMVEEDGQRIFVAANGKFDSNWNIHLLDPEGTQKFG